MKQYKLTNSNGDSLFIWAMSEKSALQSYCANFLAGSGQLFWTVTAELITI